MENDDAVQVDEMPPATRAALADNGAAEHEPQPVTIRAMPPGFMFRLALAIVVGVGFIYFTRPVVLPVIFALMAGMALKPVIRWLDGYHVPPALGAGLVLLVFILAAGFGFARLSQPAISWINDTPEHMVELKQRVQKIFRPAAKISEAAAAINNLGTPEDGQGKTATVQVKDNPKAGPLINWTGTALIGMGETLVLLYLLLSAGDMFLHKLVRVLPTLRDKRRAVEISREIQQNISNYLFAISLINLGFGVCVWAGLWLLGVPNAAMWGVLAAFLNYIPYFGPYAGMILLGAVGLLTFDTLPRRLLPPLWYLTLHLLESNLITPILIGRRFTFNPVIVFVSLIFWTWLWGVAGALLSVPILISLKAICDRAPALLPVSEFLVH